MAHPVFSFLVPSSPKKSIVPVEMNVRTIKPDPTAQQSGPSINVILMVREHGVREIAEVEEEIDALRVRMEALIKKRNTLQELVDIAIKFDA